MSSAGEHQRNFSDKLDQLQKWVTTAEDQLDGMLREPIQTDPQLIKEDLNRMKNFNAEVFTKNKQVDELKTASTTLADSLKDVGSNLDTTDGIDSMVQDVATRVDNLVKDATARCNTLQTSLVQSQGIQEGMNSLLSWLKDTNAVFAKMRPASLNSESLMEQMREFQAVKRDIESHIPSVDSITQKVHNLSQTGEPDVARIVNQKHQDLNSQFDALMEKCKERAEDLQDVTTKLGEFHNTARAVDDWIVPSIETLESRDGRPQDLAHLKEKLNEIEKELDPKAAEVESIRRMGVGLIEHPKTTDVAEVKNILATLERNWFDVTEIIDQKRQEVSFQGEQLDHYQRLKQLVLAWLAKTEMRLDKLEPVAVDVEAVAKQIEELQVGIHYVTCTNQMNYYNEL